MALSSIIKDKPYNLPWVKDHIDAIFITFFFVIPPNPIQFPIGYIYGTCVLVYFVFFVKGPNQLGLSLKLSRKAIKWLLGIVLVFLTINMGMIFLIDATKNYAAEHPEEGPFLEEMIEYDWGYYWKPAESLYQSLSDKNIGMTTIAFLKPSTHLIILAPLFETVIIFAILLPGLWKRFGYLKAVLVVSLVFILLHFPNIPFIWAFSLFAFSLLLIWFYNKTNSIYPSIVFHACFNLTMLIFRLALNWGLPYNPTGG